MIALPKWHYSLMFLICALLILPGCKKKIIPAPSTVATLQSAASFPVGAAINPDLLKNNYGYLAVVMNEYNSITTENVLKFNAVEPQQNQFDFAGGDYIMAFASQYKKRVHAHNFIWNQALPDW